MHERSLAQEDLDRGGVENFATVAGYGPVRDDDEERSVATAESNSWVSLPQEIGVLVSQSVSTWVSAPPEVHVSEKFGTCTCL